MSPKHQHVLEARFPLRGFVAVVWICGENDKKIVYPLPTLYVREDELIGDLDYLTRELRRGGTEMVDRVVILPVKLRDVHDMPQGKIRRRTVSFSAWDRFCEFFKLLECPDFYDLLVIPRRPSSGGEEFLVPIPFLSSSQRILAEKFVSLSDFPVDFRYKGYAVYQPGEMFVYDYKSHTISREALHAESR